MSKYRAPHLRGLDAMLQQRNPLPVFREYGNRYTMHGWSSLVTQCLHVTKGLLLRQMTLVTRSRCRLRPILNAKNTALERPVFTFAESFYSKKSNLERKQNRGKTASRNRSAGHESGSRGYANSGCCVRRRVVFVFVKGGNALGTRRRFAGRISIGQEFVPLQLNRHPASIACCGRSNPDHFAAAADAHTVG